MEREGYIAEPSIATAVFLAREMQKPLLIEGDAGVGKTEVAKVLARIYGTELIRLQCYEGLDVHTALYEWDYPRQMLRVRMAEQEGRSPEQIEEVIYSRGYLLERPLLRAITRREGPAGPARGRGGPRRRRLRGVPPRGALRLPGDDPGARHALAPSTSRTSS